MGSKPDTTGARRSPEVKRRHIWLACVLLAVVTDAALGQYAAVTGKPAYRTSAERYGHLQYFGFYASAMGHWDFTGELAPWTNLTWIHVPYNDDQETAIEALLLRLREARDAGVQATLSIEPFIFQNARGDLRPDEDIEDFLIELRARIEFEELLDSVALIYPKDEPFRLFLDYRNPSFYDQYVTGSVYKDIHEVLVRANELIKLTFPDKPIGVILSGYDIFHRFFSIPENYDWVGFDCYDDLFHGCDDRSFVDTYQRLLDYMQPQQKLIAVPETWVPNELLNRADWPDVLQKRLRHHYEIALNEPRFVAFVPFIWSFEAEGDVPGVGLDRFPELFDDGVDNPGTAFVDAVLRIGFDIKRDMPQFPNMAWAETEDSPDRPTESYRADIMGVTPGGLVSAWAFSDSLPHKNLRVRLQLRSANGKVVYRSAIERTFIKDDALDDVDRIGRRTPGLHGYRHWLPKSFPKVHAGSALQLELVVYADGEPMQEAYVRSIPIERIGRAWRLPGSTIPSLQQ